MSNHQRKNEKPHKATEYDIMEIPIPVANSSATHPNYATINPMRPYIQQSNQSLKYCHIRSPSVSIPSAPDDTDYAAYNDTD